MWLRLGAILILALALRVVGIDYSLWYDEVASTQFAATPVHLLWSDWMIRETNPPLYYTLLRAWSSVVGSGDVALRMLSVVIGCVGVGIAFFLGRRVGGDRAGLFAAGLIAVSAQHVMYSQQVRGYILAHTAALGATLAVLIFLEAVSQGALRRYRVRALLGYGCACLIALYAHTTMVLLPALATLFVFVRLVPSARRSWPALMEWVAVNAVLLLLWAWWGRITLLQSGTRETIKWIFAPSFPYAVRMTMESYLPWGFPPLQILVAIPIVAVAGYATWRWHDKTDRWLLPYLAMTAPLLLYLLSFKVPVFLNRTIYWSSGPFLVTVAAGLAMLRPRWATIAAVATMGIANAVALAAWFPVRESVPWRAMVVAIQRQAPGEPVLVLGKGPLLALRRYCTAPDCTLTIVGVVDSHGDGWATNFAMQGIVPDKAVTRLLARNHSFVTVRWLGQDPAMVSAISQVLSGAKAIPFIGPVVHNNDAEVRHWRVR